jgi:DNA (cytosine-5)-methyltransferase 1
MNVLSLFSGIGGLELGLERAGMTVVGQVEIDEFCRRVLAKHWPEVPRHDDVRTAAEWWGGVVRPSVDVVAGGFPCQPFSSAGRRQGIADERWGWPWMRDVISAVRPRYVVVENVAELLRDTEAVAIILGDFADLGFDVEWDVVSACSVGAPHPRSRVLFLAYPAGGDVPGQGPLSSRTPGLRAEHRGSGGAPGTWPSGWLPEPAVDRVAHGVPRRVVRHDLHALGNAVVPRVGEVAGALIMEAGAAA